MVQCGPARETKKCPGKSTVPPRVRDFQSHELVLYIEKIVATQAQNIPVSGTVSGPVSGPVSGAELDNFWAQNWTNSRSRIGSLLAPPFPAAAR